MEVIWNNEKHNLGIPTIDKQHREYFLIANEFSQVPGRSDHQARAIVLLKRLYAYSRYHFSTEESLFVYASYPGALSHRIIHEHFTDRVKEYLADVREKPNYRYDELLDFLVNWIIDHIQGEDRKYADYFKEKEVNVSGFFSAAHDGTVEADALEIWQEKKLHLEIEGVDDQHKELIFILQQTSDLNRTSPERQRIMLPEILKKLFYYAQYHFIYEEEVMARHNYPLLQSQKEMHQYFIQQLRNLAADYSKKGSALTDEIVHFLRDWIVKHILVDDRDYKKYLVE